MDIAHKLVSANSCVPEKPHLCGLSAYSNSIRSVSRIGTACIGQPSVYGKSRPLRMCLYTIYNMYIRVCHSAPVIPRFCPFCKRERKNFACPRTLTLPGSKSQSFILPVFDSPQNGEPTRSKSCRLRYPPGRFSLRHRERLSETSVLLYIPFYRCSSKYLIMSKMSRISSCVYPSIENCSVLSIPSK